MIWGIQRKSVIRERGELLGAHELCVLICAILEGAAYVILSELETSILCYTF